MIVFINNSGQSDTPPSAALIYNKIVGAEPQPANLSLRCSQSDTRCFRSNANRGKSGRVTDHLSLNQTKGVIEAAQHAIRIGLPFNRHMTIRLERMGISNRNSVKAIGAFLSRVRDWVRKSGYSIAYAWVRECGPMIGSHVHNLFHLPNELSLKGHRTRKWIEAVSGRPYRAGTIRTRKIARAAYMENLGVLLGYLCKGASGVVAEEVGLTRLQAGGAIVGKRAGWSENIGAKARRLWRLSGGPFRN